MKKQTKKEIYAVIANKSYGYGDGDGYGNGDGFGRHGG